MFENVHHVGMAIHNIEQSLDYFKSVFGARALWQSRMEDQKFETVLIAFGAIKIELLGSLEPKSFIDRFIETRGEGIHHVSIQVSDFDHTIADFKEKGLKIIGATDTDDFKAAFIHPQSMIGMLTEIIEPKGRWGK